MPATATLRSGLPLCSALSFASPFVTETCSLLWSWCGRRGSSRFQTDLPGDLLFLALHGLQGTQVEDQIPGFIGLDVVRPGRHRRSVQPGHEDLVQVFVAGATLKAVVVVKVVGLSRTVLIVRKGRGRRSIAAPGLAMALPALHFLEYCLARLDPLRRDLRLGRDLNWFSGLLRNPARREMLHVSHQVRPLLGRKRVPGWHVRAVQSAPDGVVQISVQRQSPGGSRTAFKNPKGKVARLGINPLRILPLAVAEDPVAANTIPSISALGVGSMTRQLADVAFHSQALILFLFCHLCRREAAQGNYRNRSQRQRTQQQISSHRLVLS